MNQLHQIQMLHPLHELMTSEQRTNANYQGNPANKSNTFEFKNMTELVEAANAIIQRLEKDAQEGLKPDPNVNPEEVLDRRNLNWRI